MASKQFDERLLKRLYRPVGGASKSETGQVLVIGGSGLFHGAPLLALKAASRVAGMVYFASPEPFLEKVAAEAKARLSAFIWVPWSEVEEYLEKADAVLMGPGFLRFRSEKQREACEKLGRCGAEAARTKKISEDLLKKFADKRWVIDAGSLQVMSAGLIPRGAILTPNDKEYRILFGDEREPAKKYDCVIVRKNNGVTVCSAEEKVEVKMGEAGMNKGGMGDVLAGLVVGLAAKNEPFLAAAAAAFVNQKAAENLHNRVGFVYNADDLAQETAEVLGTYWR